MKRNNLQKICGIVIFVLLIMFAKNGHLHLPGHGNVEEQNLRQAVVDHVSSMLADGKKVEFVSKYVRIIWKKTKFDFRPMSCMI